MGTSWTIRTSRMGCRRGNGLLRIFKVLQSYTTLESPACIQGNTDCGFKGSGRYLPVLLCRGPALTYPEVGGFHNPSCELRIVQLAGEASFCPFKPRLKKNVQRGIRCAPVETSNPARHPGAARKRYVGACGQTWQPWESSVLTTSTT